LGYDICKQERRVRQLSKWVVLGFAVLVLSGCGRRGPLEPAGGEKPMAAEQSDTDIGLASGKTTKVTPIKPGNKPFFLDPLL